MRAIRRLLPCVAVALLTSCAESNEATPEQASDEVAESPSADVTTVGSIRATLGGEEMTWTALAAAEGGDGSSSASYRIQPAFGDSLLILTLSGYTGTRPTIPGMLSITATFSGVPEACPCDAATPTVEYWTGFSDMYRTSGATFRLETLERGPGGILSVAGSFSGTLAADGDFEGAEGPRPIEGTFSVERVSPSPVRR